MDPISAGLTYMELARGDGSLATFVGVQAGLAVQSIARTHVDPIVDSVLIVGHGRTAAAVRGSARESALRRDRRCCDWPGGKRGSKLAARADAELSEDLAQVVGDGGAR